MNNTISNNVNFQGAFIMKAISADAKNELLELMPHKRIFFDNYRKEGDILFVTRKSLDKATADFIKEKHLKFRYYPKLTTKSGFDEENPTEAAKILKANKNGVISTLKEMYESIMPKPIREKVKIDRRDELENVFDAMGLDPKYIVIKKNRRLYYIER